MQIASLTGSLTLNEQALVADIDLSISAGWTCLLGASGAGKSTLLRAIAGLEIAAVFDGTRTAPDNIGWMAQSDLLQDRLSVGQNVSLLAKLRGKDLSGSEVEDALSAVGLKGRANDLPDTLSGGQRQRVALARVLSEDTPLVLLDEPFSALDPITRLSMQDLAAEVLKNRAVLMVTHDPVEAFRLGNRILIIEGGQVHDLPPLDGPHPKDVEDPALLTASAGLLAKMAGRV